LEVEETKEKKDLTEEEIMRKRVEDSMNKSNAGQTEA
jgi:hypothetical protein